MRQTAYSKSNQDHEALLHRLWDGIFPDNPLHHRVSKQWMKLGFENQDPGIDLKGHGLLGLWNLVYFGEHYGEEARAIVHRKNLSYPFALAGISITGLLLAMLNVSQGI